MQITSYEETGNTFHNDDHLRAGQSGDLLHVGQSAMSFQLPSLTKHSSSIVAV